MRMIWRYTALAAVGLLSLGLPGCEDILGTPDRPTGPSATPTPSPAASGRSVGCFTATNTNATTMCGIVASLGSPQADQALSQEVAIERQFWSLVPVRSVAVMNDCGEQYRNAKADPITRDIYFGYYMYNTLVSQFGNSLPAAGVLAHEWGHQVQFNFQWISNPVRPMELEADAFSGYYMALAKGWAWGYMNSYFQAVYSFGDTNFSSPGHHGTPQERLAMARVGFDTAVQAATFGRPLSYFDLHQIFYQSISRLGLDETPVRIEDAAISRIADAVGAGAAADIVAGRAVDGDERMPGSSSERRRLWPRE